MYVLYTVLYRISIDIGLWHGSFLALAPRANDSSFLLFTSAVLRLRRLSNERGDPLLHSGLLCYTRNHSTKTKPPTLISRPGYHHIALSLSLIQDTKQAAFCIPSVSHETTVPSSK